MSIFRRVFLFALFPCLTCFWLGNLPAWAVQTRSGLLPRRSPAELKTIGQKRPEKIPSPQSVLGFEPATSRTIADWKQITKYFEQLARASNRVRLQKLGLSAEGRELFAALISAPENLQQLERLKEIQRQVADPRRLTTAQQRTTALRDGKVVVVLTCSLHSVEIVASQFSMKLAYELASENRPDIKEILAQTIVVLVPSPNPDGIDIVADWYRRTLGTKDEGTNPPQLYHHYAGHDNNRDWYALTQPETQHLTRLFYQEWFPNIVFDLHQQGSFGARMTLPPFYDPPNPNIPGVILRRVAAIGEQMATDLSAEGFAGVLTRGQFDTWWHGGLRTAPYYHNAIGLLSEVASAHLMTPMEIQSAQLIERSRGFASATERSSTFPEPWTGGIWRPETIAAMERTACLSLLRYAAHYRRDILDQQLRLGEQAVAPSEPGSPTAWVIPAPQLNPEATQRMMNMLLAQGIEIQTVQRECTLGDKLIPAGSFVIPLRQPYRACVKALLEIQRYPDRNTTTGAAEPPYDITGWTLPLLMGVEAFETTQSLAAIETEPRRTLLPEAARWVEQKQPLVAAAQAAAPLGIYQNGSNEDEGWTRWLLDMERIPYRIIRPEMLQDEKNLAGVTKIIFPSQSPFGLLNGWRNGSVTGYRLQGIGKTGIVTLQSFIAKGGTMICLGQATDFAIEQLELPVRNVLKGLPTSEFFCPGSLLAIDLTADSPLAQGMPASSHAFFAQGEAFEPASATAQVHIAARYAETKPLRSGWLRGDQFLAGKAALVSIKQGSGNVILFGFRPQFRGQSHATFRLFLNAIGNHQ
ncbi:MAG: hypothetical protein K1Y36_00935 [Blastocatellia bacterium]|nr:hypothetical protein [Blastocatellia bacterium]